jgi:homoserine/homoserine lactone efflux protein
VAFVSTTSLGIILKTSAFEFNVVKMAGAIYLIFLGIRMLRSKRISHTSIKMEESSFSKCFLEGFLVSSSNPKAVIFFLSLFPQFIDISKEYTPQFILLAFTFSLLVIVIHVFYVIFSTFAKSTLFSQKGSLMLNKISGGVLLVLALVWYSQANLYNYLTQNKCTYLR